ncbi:ATP-binding protein [Vogesella sp. EB]|uniref:ATP-binding protein n=1 Tax=Vogesella sp. EB TaxID=1526735 RepID=UPI0009E4A105|nr:ATP-binding protein [Vogesella sp. EB]
MLQKILKIPYFSKEVEMKKPNEVFTPRATEINTDMYISREQIEKSLESKIRHENKHLLIHGDSGCGKTWMYKRVLGTLRATYIIVNLANASRLKSIQEAIRQSTKGGTFTQTGYTETKSANAGIPAVASGAISHAATYQKISDDPLIDALENVSKSAKSGPGIIVLDNLERIFDSPDLMRELADIITLVDDDDYSKYGVKLIIVGTPHDVRTYFRKTPTTAPISNRLNALEEVYRLTDQQSRDFFQRGLVSQLGILKEDDPDFQTVIDHSIWITDSIPQRIHEYGLILSNSRIENSAASWEDVLRDADKKWIQEHLEKNYSIIEGAMNKNSTKIQRRNQVIYCIGNINTRDFKASDVEQFLRKNFPTSTEEIALNIPQLMSELQDNLLRRTPKGDAYTFIDPAFKLCIRAMLVKQGEHIEKLEIADAMSSI